MFCIKHSSTSSTGNGIVATVLIAVEIAGNSLTCLRLCDQHAQHASEWACLKQALYSKGQYAGHLFFVTNMGFCHAKTKACLILAGIKDNMAAG
jgi:hypothetical protein